MNFEHSFARTVNAAGNPALGSDGVPSGAPVQSTTNSPNGSYKCQTTASGIGPKALLIGVTAPAAANAMSANIYMWDEKQNQWLLWAANVACAANALTSVTMPAPVTQRGIPQSVEYFVSFANVATSNGTYFFDISPSL